MAAETLPSQSKSLLPATGMLPDSNLHTSLLPGTTTRGCLLPAARRLLPAARCLLPAARCLLPAARCVLPAAATLPTTRRDMLLRDRLLLPLKGRRLLRSTDISLSINGFALADVA